jgi:hypothetical protein
MPRPPHAPCGFTAVSAQVRCVCAAAPRATLAAAADRHLSAGRALRGRHRAALRGESLLPLRPASSLTEFDVSLPPARRWSCWRRWATACWSATCCRHDPHASTHTHSHTHTHSLSLPAVAHAVHQVRALSSLASGMLLGTAHTPFALTPSSRRGVGVVPGPVERSVSPRPSSGEARAAGAPGRGYSAVLAPAH